LKNDSSILNLTLRLLIITACAGLILGIVYSITSAPIAEQQLKKETEARMSVLPAATDFRLVEGLTLADNYQEIQQVYEGTDGGSTVGYTMSVITKGYSPGLSLTIGIDSAGTITGVDIGSHGETPGLGANATNPDFLSQYVGADGPLTVVKTPTGTTGEITAITGATITSTAVTNAVNMVREFFEENFGSGSVDTVAGASPVDETAGEGE